MSDERPPRPAAAAAALACVASLPFLEGLLRGHTLYFRDLALLVLPLRGLILEGLRQGELRFWNPYVAEGTPMPSPPVSYPLELLQVLVPTPWGISLLTALHVPLAALMMFLLARALGCRPAAAWAAGAIYGLGGFALSCVNTYIYMGSLAFTPLVVLALLRAAEGGPRAVGLAALAVGLQASSLGAEMLAQAVLVGALLAAGPRVVARASRVGAAVALGGLLAAPGLLAMGGLVAGSARGQGFPTAVVLGHSVHPLTLVQTLVANWHGDLADVAGRWWGSNFFPQGFPFFLSLYLGPAALALAAVGLGAPHPLRLRLALVLAAGLAVSLGQYAGLTPLVDALPALRSVRYPSKAFLCVHLAVALLAGLGLEALAAGRAGWRRLAGLAGGLGLPLLCAPLWPSLAPGSATWFTSGFFPPSHPWPLRAAELAAVLADARAGAAMAAAVALVALAVSRGRLSPAFAPPAAAALVAADLLRAGFGLNPMAPVALVQPAPELEAILPALRAGRVYTPAVESTAAYAQARAARGTRHREFTFAALADTLTQDMNVHARVRAAYGIDLTMLAPLERVQEPEAATVAALPARVPALRAAGVSHVLSLDPVVAEGLVHVGALAIPRLAPALVHVYALVDPLPLRAVAAGRVLSSREGNDGLEVEAEAPAPTELVVRDGYHAGWRATVDGAPAPVLRADGRHRAVALPAGRHRVRMEYEPPGWRRGLALAAAALAVVAALLARR